ncbi:mitochondrial carrier [Panus rudis PR-1116 ss-1]|nr:mitochondrial carrier [Panus rudis PR-1116 ss-1]
MTSTLPPLVQAFSGGIGSATANAFSYPLDLVATRTRITTQRRYRGFKGILLALQHILRTEGWSGLFDGLGTDTIAQFLSSFLYFYFYSFLRDVLVRRRSRQTLSPTKSKAAPVLLKVSEELGIGFIAGIASRAISTPLNVITVRLQTERDSDSNEEIASLTAEGTKATSRSAAGPIDVCRSIYSEEGMKGFWRGFSTTIPLSLNPALTMFLFQVFGRLTMLRKPRSSKASSPKPGEAFVGAAVSNSIATAILYPLILAKTRLQMQKKRRLEKDNDGQLDNEENDNVLTIWLQAYAKYGWAGIYQGLEAQVVKGFVSQGVTMMVKQRYDLDTSFYSIIPHRAFL